MRRLITTAAIAIAALGATRCATLDVSSHVRSGIDFTHYRTYDWGPPDALPTGDPRLDKDPFFQDHMQGAVEKELAAKGFQRTTAPGEADLLIHYHANISQRLDVDRLDKAYGYCYGEECFGPVREYEAGTLVLDLVDRRTNTLVWRGWAQRSLEGVLNNRDRMARMINESVKRMLGRLPGPAARVARAGGK